MATFELQLDDKTLELLKAYQGYTQVTPEDYISELVTKTRPTLEAMVEAFKETQDPEELMEVYGRKLAEITLRDGKENQDPQH